MKLRSALFIILLSTAISASAQPDWSSIIDEDALLDIEASVMIKNLSTGEVSYAFHEMKPRTVASVQKLPSAMAAHEVLGDQYRFSTALYVVGQIQSGTLCGDVVIIGGGDPTLGAPRLGGVSLESMARRVYRTLDSLGITAIDGHVLIQDEVSPHYGRPGVQLLADVANYYGAGYYAVNVRENAFDITLDRTGRYARIAAYDTLAADDIDPQFITMSGQRDLAYVYDGLSHRQYFIRGSLPAGRQPYTIKGAMRWPADYLGRWMMSSFHEMKLPVSDYRVTASIDLTGDDVIWADTFLSPPLTELIKHALHRSHNLLAQAIYTAAKQRGLPSRYDQSIEGSGLTPRRSWTASGLMGLLQHSYDQDQGRWLKDHLPANGRDGTVKRVLPDRPATLYLKSGSMTGTLNYAGITETDDGQVIGFVLLANSKSASRTALYQLWQPILNTLSKL